MMARRPRRANLGGGCTGGRAHVHNPRMPDTPLTLESLEATIRACWRADTAWTPEAWNPATPAAGQCWSTAYVLRHLLGGEIVHAELLPHTEPKQRHAWNRFRNGFELDLTREQFPPGQRFRECSLPGDLLMSVAGQQARRLLARVLAALAPAPAAPA